jgi:hypothetical protein
VSRGPRDESRRTGGQLYQRVNPAGYDQGPGLNPLHRRNRVYAAVERSSGSGLNLHFFTLERYQDEMLGVEDMVDRERNRGRPALGSDMAVFSYLGIRF